MKSQYTDEQIEQIARDALNNSLGGPDTEVGRIRQRNIEAYNALAQGEWAPPEVEDRSDFVDTTVADTVNGMLPPLMNFFIPATDAVEFEGNGQEGSDREAKLATAYVNHLFTVRNDGVSILYDWFWDALTQKVGFVKVWVEEDAEEATQKYEGQSEEQLIMLLQEGWQLEGEAEFDEETGGLSFTVRKEDRKRCIKVRVIASHEMRVDANARWDDDPAMVGHVFYKRRFEWEEEGYDVSEVGMSGDRMDEESLELLGEADDVTFSAPDRSHELIRGAEIYIKLDVDADGIAEWVKICLVEDQLARYEDGKAAWEQVDDHPFVWICPNPRPHSFYGDCPADYAYQPQKLRTTTIRTLQDNMLLTVNGRTYVNTRAGVNIDDMLDSRAGGIVRGEEEPSLAFAPMIQPSLGAPAYQFVEWIGSWAENRTGFNRYAAGTDTNALNKTKGGMELLTAKADMRIGLMARHFAIGVRKMFAKLLKLSIQYQNVPEMVRLNGEFVPINPGEFRNQFRVKINVGLGTGTKEQQLARLMAMAEMQAKLGQPSGVVRPQHIGNTIRLAAELNEFKSPEQFSDVEPSGMPPTPEAYQAEKQQAMQSMQEMHGEVQRLGLENQQLKAEKAANTGELIIKEQEIGLKRDQLDLQRAEALGNFELKSRDQQMQGTEAAMRMSREARGDDEVAELKQQVDGLTQLVSQLLEVLQPQEPA
jgi:hypothetical protein